MTRDISCAGPFMWQAGKKLAQSLRKQPSLRGSATSGNSCDALLRFNGKTETDTICFGNSLCVLSPCFQSKVVCFDEKTAQKHLAGKIDWRAATHTWIPVRRGNTEHCVTAPKETPTRKQAGSDRTIKMCDQVQIWSCFGEILNGKYSAKTVQLYNCSSWLRAIKMKI